MFVVFVTKLELRGERSERNVQGTDIIIERKVTGTDIASERTVHSLNN